jgi:molecular chaperone DnaK
MAIIIGIDLGTSNSAAAVLRRGRPIRIPSAEGRRTGQRNQIRLRDRKFAPEELSALLLQQIKRDAEAFDRRASTTP